MANIVTLPVSETVRDIDPEALWQPEDDPPSVTETGMPGLVRGFVVHQDPKITVLPHFLTDVECQYLVGLADGNWFPSLVGKLENKDPVTGSIGNSQSQGRTSWSSMLRWAQTTVVERIEHRLARVAGLPVEHLERLNMVRYSPGEYFNEHHDGKFRPRTVFVYLNDLPDGDEGETLFPHLGLRFRPRRGAAVMWSNATPEGKEDSRMVHRGCPPLTKVKFGANCFFNDVAVRQIMDPPPSIPMQDSSVVHARSLVQDQDLAALTCLQLKTEPVLCVSPHFLSDAEVASVMALALEGIGLGSQPRECVFLDQDHPFRTASTTLRVLPLAVEGSLKTIQQRCAQFTTMDEDHLRSLRVIRGGTDLGYCNRGCGLKSCYVCLSDEDRVCFPRMGLVVVLQRGDAVAWPNADWSGETQFEDLRAARAHCARPDGAVSVGLEANFNSAVRGV
jgi:prolyl 4-hydroxylase